MTGWLWGPGEGGGLRRAPVCGLSTGNGGNRKMTTSGEEEREFSANCLKVRVCAWAVPKCMVSALAIKG